MTYSVFKFCMLLIFVNSCYLINKHKLKYKGKKRASGGGNTNHKNLWINAITKLSSYIVNVLVGTQAQNLWSKGFDIQYHSY